MLKRSVPWIYVLNETVFAYSPLLTNVTTTLEQALGNGTGKKTPLPAVPEVIPDALPPITTMPPGSLYQKADAVDPLKNELISGICDAPVPTFLVAVVPSPRTLLNPAASFPLRVVRVAFRGWAPTSDADGLRWSWYNSLISGFPL